MVATVDPWQVAADLIDPPPNPYTNNPRLWVDERLGEFTWSKQNDILDSVRDHRYTAVHSCHDAGKSFIASRCAAWWLDAHPPGEAFVVSTAPTFPQVRAILWREIGRAHRKGALVGRVNQTEWWIGNEVVGYGRKPADTDPAAFQGIHARFVLVIIDEACGVPKPIFDAVDALATNEEARVLAIGNPDNPAAHFATVCRPGSGWNVIHIDGLQTPNFTGEHVPDDLRPLLLSPTWVEERKHRWGENSPLYLAKVRGIFPVDADDGVVRASKLAACRVPNETLTDADLLPIELGIDVGAGGDETVIWERRGRRAGRVWRNQSKDPNEVIDLCLAAIFETGATAAKVDTIGWGWGIAGALERARQAGEHRCEIVPVNVATSPADPERFPLLRDELWWEIGREFCEHAWWDLAAIDDDCAAQLLAPKYSLLRGKVKIEAKADTKERLGRSPDDADALLMAFWTPPPVFDEHVDAEDLDPDHAVEISPY